MKFPSFGVMNKIGYCFVGIFLFGLVFKDGIIGDVHFTVENAHMYKNSTVVSEIVDHTQEMVYKDNIPTGISRVSIIGKDEVFYYDKKGNKITVQEMVPEVVQVGTGKIGSYSGRLTGYGPDCVGCSKTGSVACKTRDGKKYSLIYDGIYYTDSEYGNVRIVSTPVALFPCGTIIEIDNGKTEPFIVVALDHGSSMNRAWSNGSVWIDLAFSSQVDAKNGNTSSKDAKFQVKRWGW